MKKSTLQLFLLIILILGFTHPLLAQAIPDKDFKIFMVTHSHADLSWPDTPEICTNLNVQAIKKSIEILKELKDFKFSEEDVFVLQEFLRRYPSQTEEVKDLFKKIFLNVAHSTSVQVNFCLEAKVLSGIFISGKVG